MGMIVGEFLKDARETRGLSQAQVAVRLNLGTAQSISNIERGVSPLPKKKIAKYGSVLGISAHALAGVQMIEYNQILLRVIAEKRKGRAA